MVVTPDTDIFLLKVPFTMDYKNQLTFANKEKQFEYFSSLESLELHNATYMRHNGVLRYPRTF